MKVLFVDQFFIMHSFSDRSLDGNHSISGIILLIATAD